MTHISRRTAVKGTAVLGLGTAFGGLLASVPTPAAAAESAPAAARERRPTSHNGWETEKRTNEVSTVWTRPVPGTPCQVDVRIGEVETVLVHVIRRFHYEIDTLLKGDVMGWRAPAEVHAKRAESNQASGTAVQIRPAFYPAGSRGGFFAPQLVVIRDILAELEGVVRWGGDDDRPDESLFYLDVGPSDPALSRVAGKLRTWREQPGKGAGSPVDPLSAKRRDLAKALEHRQRGNR
ncbi:hypothetical protein [Streptomyces sp. NPDC005573]|uniref:hypothetical protein n=1 Tax=Streptomyces sp. NPDC005573 TaxID=3156890 RepID=UPI0033B4A2D3